jgi:hypothetical protein
MAGNDSKGKGKVIEEKEKILVDGDLKDDAPVDSGTNKKEGKRRKRIKNISTTTVTPPPLHTRMTMTPPPSRKDS